MMKMSVSAMINVAMMKDADDGANSQHGGNHGACDGDDDDGGNVVSGVLVCLNVTITFLDADDQSSLHHYLHRGHNSQSPPTW